MFQAIGFLSKIFELLEKIFQYLKEKKRKQNLEEILKPITSLEEKRNEKLSNSDIVDSARKLRKQLKNNSI